MAAKKPSLFESAAELGVQRRPGDWGRSAQSVQPVGEPDINIERHGAIAQMLDSRLQQRGRVVAGGAENTSSNTTVSSKSR